jgi:4-oxalocrotonate tautomerase
MPFINVKILEGVFTRRQKSEMIRKLAETMVSIKGENIRSATSVVIQEVKSGDWGIAGQPLTTSDAKSFLGGKRRPSKRIKQTEA